MRRPTSACRATCRRWRRSSRRPGTRPAWSASGTSASKKGCGRTNAGLTITTGSSAAHAAIIPTAHVSSIRSFATGCAVTDETEYLTDAFARESVDFIERSKDRAVLPVPRVQRRPFAAGGDREVRSPLPAHLGSEAQDVRGHAERPRRRRGAGAWRKCANSARKRTRWSSSTATTAVRLPKRPRATIRCVATKGNCSKAASASRS